MIQPFLDEDEDMEMPCICDCGRVFDLHDGIRHPKKNSVICRKCGERFNEINDIQQKISNIEDWVEMALMGKRQGKRQIKELQEKLKRLENQ